MKYYHFLDWWFQLIPPLKIQKLIVGICGDHHLKMDSKVLESKRCFKANIYHSGEYSLNLSQSNIAMELWKIKILICEYRPMICHFPQKFVKLPRGISPLIGAFPIQALLRPHLENSRLDVPGRWEIPSDKSRRNCERSTPYVARIASSDMLPGTLSAKNWHADDVHTRCFPIQLLVNA